jgi:sugar/nucleoside kinase (ribokinase family)
VVEKLMPGRSSWRLTVVGTVDLDDITTPAGHRSELLGGSAVYSALAAAHFTAVNVVASVGRDAEPLLRKAFADKPIEARGVTVTRRPTRRWTAVHDFKAWKTSEEATTGGYPEWRPKLDRAAADGDVLFVGSMAPAAQLDAIRQSTARLVGADTMKVFIDADRNAVLQVAVNADVLFLTVHEAAALAQTSRDEWKAATHALVRTGRLRAVIVKAGPSGAICLTGDAITEIPAHPVATVVDPTGAGDSLAGAFLGACAQASRDDNDYFHSALDTAMPIAAKALTDFGTLGLG